MKIFFLCPTATTPSELVTCNNRNTHTVSLIDRRTKNECNGVIAQRLVGLWRGRRLGFATRTEISMPLVPRSCIIARQVEVIGVARMGACVVCRLGTTMSPLPSNVPDLPPSHKPIQIRVSRHVKGSISILGTSAINRTLSTAPTTAMLASPLVSP